jgi:hypothetical protein
MSPVFIVLAVVLAVFHLAADGLYNFWLRSGVADVFDVFANIFLLLFSTALCSFPAFAFAFRASASQSSKGSRGLLTFVCVGCAVPAIHKTIVLVVEITSLTQGSIWAERDLVWLVLCILAAGGACLLSLIVLFLAFLELARVTRHLIGHFIVFGFIAVLAAVRWTISVYSNSTFQNFEFMGLSDRIVFALAVSSSPPACLIFRVLLDNTYVRSEAVLSLVFSIIVAVASIGLGVMSFIFVAQAKFPPGDYYSLAFLIIDALCYLGLGALFACHTGLSFSIVNRVLQQTYSPLLAETHMKDVQSGLSGSEN